MENKIELGKEYKTRDGRSVEVLKVDLKDTRLPVVAVLDDGKSQCIEYFTACGKFYSDGSESKYDLVEVVNYKRVSEFERFYFLTLTCEGVEIQDTGEGFCQFDDESYESNNYFNCLEHAEIAKKAVEDCLESVREKLVH